VRIITHAGFEPSTVFALLKGLGPKYEEVRLLAQSITVIQNAQDFFQPNKKTRAFEMACTVSQ
jgi:hypothetical protein